VEKDSVNDTVTVVKVSDFGLSKIIMPRETNLKLNKDLISLQDYLKLNEKINKK
jgi:hypothetical protein